MVLVRIGRGWVLRRNLRIEAVSVHEEGSRENHFYVLFSCQGKPRRRFSFMAPRLFIIQKIQKSFIYCSGDVSLDFILTPSTRIGATSKNHVWVSNLNPLFKDFIKTASAPIFAFCLNFFNIPVSLCALTLSVPIHLYIRAICFV